MPSGGNSLGVPPDARHLELSVFGPGFGESLLLHLGNGNWAVVDSCLDRETGEPAALRYLSQISVDPSRAIQLVVATHWHDDHIRGISKVFEMARSATFVCTGALEEHFLKKVVTIWQGTRLLPGGSGVDEINQVLRELKRRSPNSQYAVPKLAGVGRRIWPIPDRENPMGMSIKCLAPSDAAVLATQARLAAFFPPKNTNRRRLPLVDANGTSVVLSVEASGHRILLGGDLDSPAERSLGWLSIVDDHSGVDAKHQAFKVPHHGSAKNDHDDMWRTLTTSDVYTVTTPFVTGGVSLPKTEDCSRILGKSPNAYLSAPPVAGRFRDGNRAVERAVLETARSVQVVPGKYGHVRLRKAIAGAPHSPWDIELFGSAVKMSDYLSGVR